MKSKLVKLALVSAVAFSVIAGSTLALACPNGWSGSPCKQGMNNWVKQGKKGMTERQKKDEYDKVTLEPSVIKATPNLPSAGEKCITDKAGKTTCVGKPTTE